MHFEIRHSTRYTYDREVRLNPHLLYLRPLDSPLCHITRFKFHLEPVAARIDWMQDDFDNFVAAAQFNASTRVLLVETECTVETSDSPIFDFVVRDYARRFPFAYEALHRFNLSIYLTPPAAPVKKIVHAWVDRHFKPQPAETVAWAFALNQMISQTLRYQRRDDPGMQGAEETIALGSGSCRDFAVLFVACARTLGLAARFVSGYLHDPGVDGRFSGDMHAWVEIFLPGAGWRGLDPSRGIFCDNSYIPVAHAVVAESVNPIQGSYFSATPAHAVMQTDVRVQGSPGTPPTP